MREIAEISLPDWLEEDEYPDHPEHHIKKYITYYSRMVNNYFKPLSARYVELLEEHGLADDQSIDLTVPPEISYSILRRQFDSTTEMKEYIRGKIIDVMTTNNVLRSAISYLN